MTAWTPAEDKILLEMVNAGHICASISDQFRDRSTTAVKCRITKLKRRAGIPLERLHHTKIIQPTLGRRIVPDDVLADAKRRAMAVRSLTALICGDPAPGFSQLDRKDAMQGGSYG